MADMHDDIFIGEFEFSGVGRRKANFKATLNGETSLYLAVKPYLMSKDIGYSYDLEAKKGDIDAGGRMVGSFRKV